MITVSDDRAAWDAYDRANKRLRAAMTRYTAILAEQAVWIREQRLTADEWKATLRPMITRAAEDCRLVALTQKAEAARRAVWQESADTEEEQEAQAQAQEERALRQRFARLALACRHAHKLSVAHGGVLASWLAAGRLRSEAIAAERRQRDRQQRIDFAYHIALADLRALGLES